MVLRKRQKLHIDTAVHAPPAPEQNSLGRFWLGDESNETTHPRTRRLTQTEGRKESGTATTGASNINWINVHRQL